MLLLPQLERDKQMLCISSNEHYLAAGIDCYKRAVTKLITARKQDLALKLCLQVLTFQDVVSLTVTKS